MIKGFFAAAGLLAATCVPASADVIADWYEAAGTIGSSAVAPGGVPDPKTGAQVALAMFEAVNAIDRRYESYLGFPAASPPASAEAAASAAAAEVLKAAFPKQAETIDQALAYDLGLIADSPEETAGIELGRAAAAAVLKREPSVPGKARDYLPSTTPGLYVPTDLPVLPMTAYLAKCYFLSKPDEFSPGGPPALTSERYTRDFDEVRRLGRRTASERTPAQTAAATFWAGNDYGLALRLLAAGKGRSLVRNARAYALLAMANADARAAITVAKYDNHFWRPITSIRNAETDGNPKTQADSSWEPLLRTPMHPEYPCGHCIGASVTATIFAAEFGRDAPMLFLDPTMPGAAQTLTPAEYVKAVSMSRVYAGVHYRFSNEAAEEMGHKIGEKAVGSFMRPVK